MGIAFPSTEATPVATQREEEFPPRSTVRMDLRCGTAFPVEKALSKSHHIIRYNDSLVLR
jgi:hypothetical protein